MSVRKMHKKDFQPKKKDQIGETFQHGRPTSDKVKYKYKNHWIEEEMEEMVPYRMKKKRVDKK